MIGLFNGRSAVRILLVLLTLTMLLAACGLVQPRPARFGGEARLLTATPTRRSTVEARPQATRTAAPLAPTSTSSSAMLLAHSDPAASGLQFPLQMGVELPQDLPAITVDNLLQAVEIATWGRGVVEDLAFAARGSLLAVATSTGVYLYEHPGLKVRDVFSGSSPLTSLALSPDGTLLAAGDRAGKVHLWRVEDGELLRTFNGHEWIRDVAFSSDGRYLGAGSDDGDLRIWQVSDGLVWRVFTGERHTSTIAFSPDGRTFAAGAGSEIWIWDIAGEEQVAVLRGHQGRVTVIAYSPDGETLASGSLDRTVKLWNPSDGVLLETLSSGSYVAVHEIAFSPTGDRLAVGLEGRRGDVVQGTVQLWDLDDGSLELTLEAVSGAIGGLAFTPDGRWLASSNTHQVRLWDAANGLAAETLDGFVGPLYSVEVSPDGAYLATGSADGSVRLWRSQDGVVLVTQHDSSAVQPQSPALPVAFSPDGSLLASAVRSGGVRLWQVPGGPQTLIINGSDRATALAFSPDGSLLAIASADGELALWNTSSGAHVQTLCDGGGCPAAALKFSPDGAWLAAGLQNGLVQIYRTADGSLARTLTAHRGVVRGLSFSPDGTLLATGAEDGVVRVWSEPARAPTPTPAPTEPATGEAPAPPEDWGAVRLPVLDTASAMAFSPDGRLLCIGTQSGVVQVWDLRTNEMLRQLSGHSAAVNAVAFSRGGSLIISAAEDGALRLWGVP